MRRSWQRMKAGQFCSGSIDGAVMFCRNRFHLTIPYAIAVAAQEYKQREDWLHLFLSEYCTQEYGARIRCGELYNAYKEYAVSTGDYCRRLTDFNAAMETAGLKQLLKMGNKKFWIGIRVQSDSLSGERNLSVPLW